MALEMVGYPIPTYLAYYDSSQQLMAGLSDSYLLQFYSFKSQTLQASLYFYRTKRKAFKKRLVQARITYIYMCRQCIHSISYVKAMRVLLHDPFEKFETEDRAKHIIFIPVLFIWTEKQVRR